MEIGLLAAFLGGTLALLSPCGALLLPAWLATTAGSAGQLAWRALVFWLGLAAVLVPLGAGVGAVGAAFATHREVVIAVGATVMIVLGLWQAVGGGVDLGRLIPWRSAASGPADGRPVLRTFLLGTVSGAAGFCAGPILGAVLGLAAGGGSPARGSLLLAVYGAGMVVPLVGLAAGWQRWGATARARLRGGAVRVAGREVHLVSVVTGALLVVIGVAFWLTNGFVGVPELVPTAWLAAAQNWLVRLGRQVPDLALLAGVLGGVGLVGWWLRRRGTHRAESAQR